mmetsp:Transcript_59340/g.68723  ORF Transcript_59340/g.68723 Transcript_59340/m.68723 type:complete len:587 (-) Transcript_59340:335-2095(-)
MALVTGKPLNVGQSFHRKLLSEYNADFTLENYVAYFELKALVTKFVSAKTESQRAEIEGIFFTVLQESFHRVKSFLHEQETTALTAVRELKRCTEEELRAAPLDKVPALFHSVRNIAKFRELNLSGFGKILRKFADRCAAESLSSQQKVREADRIISKSHIGSPVFDANLIMDELLAIFGVVFKKTYEETMLLMDRFTNRDSSTYRRIPPCTDSYFFFKHFAHRETQGRFAIRIASGRSSKQVSKMICEHLQCPVFPAKVDEFANGEVSVVLEEAVRGDDVFVVQSMVNRKDVTLSTSIMELALLLQTSMQNSAARVTAVIPYIAYTKNTASAAALAEILVIMGCKHVITVDLYKEQVEGMFPNCPVDNVSSKFEFIHYLTQMLRDEGNDFKNLCVVSPDSETVARAHSFADAFMKYAELDSTSQFIPICTAVKRVHGGETPASLERQPPASASDFPCAPKGMELPKRGSSGTIDVVGNVQGKLCFIIDCVIDEGVNMVKVANRLKMNGASRIVAIATHAIFSADAVERLVHSPIDEIIITDSICQDEALKNAAMAKKLRIISIVPLLAQAIQRVHTENTLSTMFE